MKQQTQKERVEWLLNDLCTQLGFCMANRCPEKFEALVADGADAFTDAVLVVEGLSPEMEKHLRRRIRELVSKRFERWSSVA